jgi:hypothetical protein
MEVVELVCEILKLLKSLCVFVWFMNGDAFRGKRKI